MQTSEFPITSAVADVGFPDHSKLTVSPFRPLFDVPDAMLFDIKQGLDGLNDKRLCAGNFVKGDGSCCAVGAGLLNAQAKKEGTTVESVARTYRGCNDDFAPWSKANWNAVSGRVNDKFGKGEHEQFAAWNHPAVQKARYFYVYGIVASELALRGLL